MIDTEAFLLLDATTVSKSGSIHGVYGGGVALTSPQAASNPFPTKSQLLWNEHPRKALGVHQVRSKGERHFGPPTSARSYSRQDIGQGFRPLNACLHPSMLNKEKQQAILRSIGHLHVRYVDGYSPSTDLKRSDTFHILLNDGYISSSMRKRENCAVFLRLCTRSVCWWTPYTGAVGLK